MILNRWQNALIRLAALSIPVVLLLYGYKVWSKVGYTDFEVYYRAADLLMSGRAPEIYDPASGASPFRYGPWNLILFAPLSLFSFEVARLIWFGLNALCYAIGFAFLFRTAKVVLNQKSLSASPTVILSLVYLSVLRFMLDSFTIGQITGIMFAALGAATWAFVAQTTPMMLGAALFLPASLKLGGAVQLLFPLADFFQSPVTSTKYRASRTVIGAILAAVVLAASSLWLISRSASQGGSPDAPNAITQIWNGYRAVSESTFDAPTTSGVASLNAHYGSQSLLSALLRLSANGWLSDTVARTVWMFSGVAAVFALIFLSFRWPPQNPLQRLERWSLGILLYLLWMPFQFKYGYPLLAIPVLALVLGDCTTVRVKWALAFGALTLSLAGLDLYGATVFFALQKASIPVLAVGLLTFVLVDRHTRSLASEA